MSVSIDVIMTSKKRKLLSKIKKTKQNKQIYQENNQPTLLDILTFLTVHKIIFELTKDADIFVVLIVKLIMKSYIICKKSYWQNEDEWAGALAIFTNFCRCIVTKFSFVKWDKLRSRYIFILQWRPGVRGWVYRTRITIRNFVVVFFLID